MEVLAVEHSHELNHLQTLGLQVSLCFAIARSTRHLFFDPLKYLPPSFLI